MAQAVRVVTVERGIDPRELALVPFGGAGPLHAAQIAEELGMRRVLVPVASGVLSAFGLVVAERRRDLVESVLLTGDALTAERIGEAVERLAERGREELRGSELELRAASAELRATYDLRYAGQAFELPVEGEPAPDPAELRRAFDRAHEDRYGYSRPRRRARARDRARGRGAARRRAAAGRLGRAAGRRRRGPAGRRAARVDARGARRAGAPTPRPTWW